MQSLTPNLLFLVDENVNSKLYKFLKLKGFDVILIPKTFKDKDIAKICLKERRILITNDEDFSQYSADEIYSVIWLKIPQNKPDVLITLFEKLLSECKNYSGKIITLGESDWQDFSL